MFRFIARSINKFPNSERNPSFRSYIELKVFINEECEVVIDILRYKLILITCLAYLSRENI